MHVLVVLALGAVSLVGCRKEPKESTVVVSRLEGRLTVAAAVDSIPDYRGFEILVRIEGETGVDTLGYTVTDSTGDFSMDVRAVEPGIYPLRITRRGTLLRESELVVTAGDTARVEAEFPLGNRLLRIRSSENAAWMAYRNTRAQYHAALLELLRGGSYDADAIRTNVQRTASILWSLRQSYPGTVGSELAAAEAVAIVGGWDDSLALSYARQIEPGETGYADVARVARQAQARITDHEDGLKLVRAFLARSEDVDERMKLRQEVLLAFLDLGQPDSALAVARTMVTDAPGSAWAEWARRAMYELETLQPGMEAPPFALRTLDGRTVGSGTLRGKWVLLEFYMPQNTIFQRELDRRNALYHSEDTARFAVVSVSVEPDTLLNEAFQEGRDFPGLHVVAPSGLENDLARRYNVNVLPTRYLIDPDGRIRAKYVGASMDALRQDVEAFTAGMPDDSGVPPS